MAANWESVQETVEHRLIEKIKALTGERLIGDDCAILPGQQLVTVDTLVEGTHFLLPDISLEDLAWKSVAVNLSDIAAMAGRPRYIFAAVTLPGRFESSAIERFFGAMVDCARTYKTRIVGGDLTRGVHMSVSLTVIGEQHEDGIFRRTGARSGDTIIVTGDFGASAAGLWLMQQGLNNFQHCRRKHFHPEPRLSQSWWLVHQTGGNGAMMDASDGLADALIQISRASGVGMNVHARQIPLDPQTKCAAELAGQNPLDWALYGGEDYELVACIRTADWQRIKDLSGNPFTAIGTVTTAEQGVMLNTIGSRPEVISLRKTFQHWG